MEYGLDYAMHRHDIERFEEVSMNEVNAKLALGWKPLHIGTIHLPNHNEDSSFWIVMGVPRPKICDSNFDGSHEETVKVFDLRDNEWCCPKCVELENNKNPLSALGSPQC